MNGSGSRGRPADSRKKASAAHTPCCGLARPAVRPGRQASWCPGHVPRPRRMANVAAGEPHRVDRPVPKERAKQWPRSCARPDRAMILAGAARTASCHRWSVPIKAPPGCARPSASTRARGRTSVSADRGPFSAASKSMAASLWNNERRTNSIRADAHRSVRSPQNRTTYRRP